VPCPLRSTTSPPDTKLALCLILSTRSGWCVDAGSQDCHVYALPHVAVLPDSWGTNLVSAVYELGFYPGIQSDLRDGRA
jgi:hypothetical protein